MSQPHSFGFGARLIGPQTARFRIWAPDSEAVSLEIDDRSTFAMERDEAGVFMVEAPCRAGARYRYRLASGATVPDPASFAQDSDVHDSSIVVDHGQYRWRVADWLGRPWHEAVIYELHVGLYGGFAAVAADLPRLAKLGFTAIEIMPIADFPGKRNWGYDGVLPYAPDNAYGSPDELKALVDRAHELGLMVLLDVVYNHFGPDGNYLNSYAAPFFRQDIHTPWGGAIDFGQSQVQRFFIENAIYWLNGYRFDGLRFDAVHAINDTGFLMLLAHEIRHTVSADRKIHLILENEKNDARLLNSLVERRNFDAQWSDDWHHCVHVLLTGEKEGYYEDFQQPARQLARALREGFVYQGEPSPHASGKPRGTPSGQLPSTCFVIALQNHDQIGNRAMGERLSSLAPPQALRAATLLLLMTPQIPLVFMGDEWSETRPFLYFTDHHDELAEAVRNGRRKEFARFATFADPEQRETIPDPNAIETFKTCALANPESPTPRQAETLALYEQALRFRAEHIIPRLVGATAIDAIALGDASVRASWKMGDGAVLTIAANLGAKSVMCPAGEGMLLITTASGMTPEGTLPGYTTCVWLHH